MIRANRPIRAVKIGVSLANDSRDSIRANRVANRPCHSDGVSASRDVEIQCLFFRRVRGDQLSDTRAAYFGCLLA